MKSNPKVTDSLISEKWFQDVSFAARKHLLNSLENLRTGSPTTPPFKLYGKFDWSVVTDFFHSLSSDIMVPKWLFEYEMSREEKYGPQGGHAPWAELRENAEMYYTRNTEVKRTGCDSETLAKYKELHLDMLSAMVALDTLKNDGKIKTRAAGWRAFNLKKTDKEAQRMALEDLKSGKWRKGWAYFFSRFNKQKKRLFVPMPYSNMVGQAQYYNPFLKAIQKDLKANMGKSKFTFWGDKIGFEYLFHFIIEPLLAGLDPSHIVYIMRDFDKMDTSTGVSQKSNYFIPKVAAAFHFGEGSENYSRMEELMLFSNRCPIATPEGMWTGDRGEASGATVTNGGETACNEEYDGILRYKLEELCREDGISHRIIGSYGNGDDGITIAYLDDINAFDRFQELIRTAADYASEQTGFVIQSEKWDIHLGSYGKYCQYVLNWDGSSFRAMYPAALILNSICNPEKQYSPAQWDKDYRDIDIIMKLSNGRELPYFHELIDYVDNGMKYRLLQGSEEATRRILSKWDSYRALQDNSVEFNKWSWNDDGDDGLITNPVVQYLIHKNGWSI